MAHRFFLRILLFVLIPPLLCTAQKERKAYELIYQDVQILKQQVLELEKKIGLQQDEFKTIKQQMEEAISLLRMLQSQQVSMQEDQKKVPAQYKTEHREFDTDFTALMVGNIWRPDLLEDLSQAWDWAGKELGELRPIEWLCHPRAVESLRGAGIDLGSHIRYIGYLPEAEFQEKLRDADMSIILLNREAHPETDYARFSLPSRISDGTRRRG